MIEAIDGVLSWAPFVARRRIGFSDCDPAGVVYAANYYRFALWAFDLFRDRHLRDGAGHLSMPAKAFAIVHRAPLRPGHVLDLSVTPSRVGTTTFGADIAGVSDGRAVYDAELTLICMPTDVWSACPLPWSLRQTLAAMTDPAATEVQS